jgi:hypothetical protein
VNFITKHWKHVGGEVAEFIYRYHADHIALFDHLTIKLCAEIITQSAATCSTPTAIPGAIAQRFAIEKLEATVTSALSESGYRLTVLFDALDEGWEPTPLATAVLGGLALAVADVTDRSTGIFGLLFMRDNIFRALAYMDSDFSRHIEGASLRLRWDHDQLLHLVANRLRATSPKLDEDSDIKTWNRFGHRGLREKDGFRHCLRYTLLRPRDVLVLLNTAYQVAQRAGRTEIVDDDIERSARSISEYRLGDLLKEYAEVFPGLGHFVEVFRGGTPFDSAPGIMGRLDKALARESYKEVDASDFAVLGSGEQIFLALYSVGFLGVSDPEKRGYIFCHDGSRSPVALEAKELTIAVHPCYWKALDIEPGQIDPEFLTEIYDDYAVRINPETTDLRTKQLGRFVTELSHIPAGLTSAKEFEEWALRCVKILFLEVSLTPNFTLMVTLHRGVTS